MKKTNKILSAICCVGLSIVTLFSAVGCKPNEVESAKVDEPTKVTYAGTHIYTAPDTSDYLVKSGRSEFTVVVPELKTITNSDGTEEIVPESAAMVSAREEFICLFEKATNIKLHVIRDTGLEHDATKKYISIGRTSLLSSSGIEINESELGSDGGRIVTKDKTIYICGGQDWGTLFAVYTFMSITFNYETYHIDCMEIDENVYNKSLKAYDVTDIPDFEHRGSNNTITSHVTDDYDESMFKLRLRQKGSRGYTFMPVYKVLGDTSSGGRSSTNSTDWLPLSTYEEDHSGWFSDNGAELCFTAHGDETEYRLMLEECLKKIKFSWQTRTINKYPHYDAMTLTQQDFNGYCTCSACQDIYKKYNNNRAAVQLLFMNDLGEMLDEARPQWKEEEETQNAELSENNKVYWVRDTFYLLFFAYSYTKEPPAKYDFDTEEWIPIDEDVRCRDNVGIYYADSGTTSKSFFADENQAVRDRAEGWGAITDNIYLWQYATNFRNYMIINDSYNYYTSEELAYFANFSNRQWFNQMQEGSTGRSLTAWHNVKVYLDAKLAWDTSLDYETLIKDYFRAMYKDAAEAMLTAFTRQRAYFAGTVTGDQPIVGATNELLTREVFPLPLVESWVQMFDDAKKLVERYKNSDPEEYDRICQHIEAEAISPLYIILKLYDGKLTATEKAYYVDRLYYDIEWIGLEKMVTVESSAETATLKYWLDQTYS